MSIVFTLFVVSINVRGQEPSTSFNPPTIHELKKNEISINSAPFFKVLLNAQTSDVTRFSATYKRNLNEKSALRFSIVADKVSNLDYNFYTNTKNEIIIVKNDSVMIKQKTITSGYVSPYIKLGYERLFGKKKLKWFYGADLSVGYSKRSSYKQNTTLIKDSTQGPNSWVETMEYRADILSKTTTKIISVGINPFFGVKYPISKHFSISAQVGVDMFYRNENTAANWSKANRTSRISTLDFNEDAGFLNDISLVYKF